MADKIPEDIRLWLREKARSAKVLSELERRQLGEVLHGPLMEPVWRALSSRLDGIKDQLLSLEMATAEDVTKAKAMQAEARGIIVVLETMWEQTNANV